MGGHNFFQTMNIFFIYTDLEAMADTFFITITDTLILAKTCFFIKNIKILKGLMNELKNDVFRPKTIRQFILVQVHLDTWKSIYYSYGSVVIGTGFFWCFIPLLDGSFRRHRLPFAAWYPYNTETSPFYELTYVYQTICFTYFFVGNLSVDSAITSLMMYTAAQCDIFCNKIQNMTPESDKIADFVKHHKKIIRNEYTVCLKNQ